MSVKAVIFDMDGTLLDSMYIWDNIGSEYLKSQNIQPKKDLGNVLKTMSLYQAAQYFIADYGVNKQPEEIIDEINKFVANYYLETVTLKNGVKELLEFYKSIGIKMCVATATDSHLAEPALKRTKIFNYFDFILTCSQVKSGKDSSVIFEVAMKKLNVKKEEIIVFEDALHAVIAAKKAGFTVYGVAEKTAESDKSEITKIADKFLFAINEAIK